ncbi:ketosteroid isomerase-like protein [Nocardioides daedukensis]|uniref:Ketosteroid isomerase-like protein n=1 Tax=Nocardioides daedukensis TaxID=634462 RepID=A0A7Y9RY06_9ACTN|nr:hypothetical protein [Nocardioides daedukensis]NYG58746.1 ketosteroid isomerase-like protein [Nocardioides daedukensis]
MLDALLTQEFEGVVELRAQVPECKFEEVDEDGTLAVHASGPRANVKFRVPVEAIYADADGVMVHVLLHVVGGRLDEVEVFREDGDSVVRKPATEIANFEYMVLG